MKARLVVASMEAAILCGAVMKIAAVAVFALSLTAFAADKTNDKPKTAPVGGQPAMEILDLDAITRIRDEGLNHSHVMEYASGLFDGIGARLTGSPGFGSDAATARGG